MKRAEILTAIMGLAIAIAGALFLINGTGQEGGSTIGDVISFIVMIVGGATVVLFSKKGIKYGVILALMTLSISTLISNLYYILNVNDDIGIIFADLYVIISIVIIYYALSLIFHTTSGSAKAIICLGILAFTELFPTLYKLYNVDGFIPLADINIDKLAYGIVHLIVIFILTRKEMLLEGPKKRLDRNSMALYDGRCAPADCYIDVNDLDKVLGESEEDWVHYSSGPIESEKEINLHGTNLGLRLQKWKGDDRRHVAVCMYNAGSYTVPLTFPIESIVPDSEDRSVIRKLRFYGKDGMFIDILVKNYCDEPKGYLETFKMNFMKNKD